MKILIALYAGTNSRYQFESIFDGKSAFERAVDWAFSYNTESRLLLLADSENEEKIRSILAAYPPAEHNGVQYSISIQKNWDAFSVLNEISEQAKKNDCKTVLFGLSSCPFYCTELTEYIISHHTRYACEYTFADGYADGLAPSAIHADSLALAANLLCGDKCGGDKYDRTKGVFSDIPITANLFFDVIKNDINSFEVETVISPEDVRMYRLNFSCISKQTMLSCKALFDLMLDEAKKNDTQNEYKIGKYNALELCQKAVNNQNVLRTIPSFYNIQISCYAHSEVIYSPYWSDYYGKTGHYPNEAKEKNPEYCIDKNSFKKLITEIADFSGEAVVSLSAWGEPLSHPYFCELVQMVLENEGLSLLVETDGLLLSEKIVNDCKKIIEKTGGEKRKNGHKPIYWIVALDAASKEQYSIIHLAKNEAEKLEYENDFLRAGAAFELLQKEFASAAYPQFTRINENENELETFYRSYKEKGNVLIQKYDWFSGRLPDRLPADLSPLVRVPCWHSLRDLVILANGNVPNCREYSLSEDVGNVFALGVAEAWQRSGQQGKLCKECDEYYTFNF